MNKKVKPLLENSNHLQGTETIKILKQLALSERALGELKGVIKKVPNEAILLNTLFLQEAKASSEIENIVTTNDEVYMSSIGASATPNAKGVQNYKEALSIGFQKVKESNLFLNKNIKQIQAVLEGNNAGFRTQSGTTLKDGSGSIVYTPPQDIQEIEHLMSDLEKFINNNSVSTLNPLVKMAIIHHQFESIHPFYDGNGRVGRIINILYLTQQKLLDIPALYLSRYVVDNKADYYRLLQEKREKDIWEDWILFILIGVEETARQTISLIEQMIALMQEYKIKIREEHSTIYSQDLINSLFKHPYTKIEFLTTDLGCNRQTAAKYLNNLAKTGYLSKIKIKNSNYYINNKLCNLFLNIRNL